MESNIASILAILGKFTLPPGIQEVKIEELDIDCLVSYSYSSNIIDEKRDIKVETEDCTIFKIIHLKYPNKSVIDSKLLNNILEKSLLAISEVIIFYKTKDVVTGKSSTHSRQVGRLDVKYFFIDGEEGCKAAWKNPAFWLDLSGFSVLGGFLGNIIVKNGPASNPIPQVIRRIMGSIDLLNLGFYTEAFITSFSLLDDLVQDTVKAGLNIKGLDQDSQKEMLRAIKEERLKHYLTNLLKLCDWISLEEDNTKLFKDLKKINTLRNNIMHGNKRINRQETIDSIEIILSIIDWLRHNPFDFVIEEFPNLSIVNPEFIIFENNKGG